MKLVDTNVLLTAVNEASPDHGRARRWLESALSGGEAVGFAWVALIGFIRISTRARIMPVPLTIDQALLTVDDWLAPSPARLLQPTVHHATVLADLLRATGTGGNLVNDAHLAALALEHRAEVITFDADFARFPGVRWSPPPA